MSETKAAFEYRECPPEREELNRQLGRIMNGNVVEMWFITDDGYEMPLNEDNCYVHMNALEDAKDHVAILDMRDGSWFSFFRKTPKDFNEILESCGAYSTYIHTSRVTPIVEKWWNSQIERITSAVDADWDTLDGGNNGQAA